MKCPLIKTDIASKFQKAMDTFQDVSEEDGDQDYLKLFSFICELSFDVYMKMQMIEQLTDQLRAERPDPKKK